MCDDTSDVGVEETMQGLRAVLVPVAGQPVPPRHSPTVDLTSYAAVSVQSVPTQAAEKRWEGLKRGPDDYNVGDLWMHTDAKQIRENLFKLRVVNLCCSVYREKHAITNNSRNFTEAEETLKI